MSQYKIITDSGCDLPKEMIRELGIVHTPLYVRFRGEEMEDAVDDSIRTLYAGLRAGENATTSAANPEQWKKVIAPVLEEGLDALVLTFSSGLSTTSQCAFIAAEELQGQFPQRRIRVVDTLSASLGQGLLVWYACQKQQEGMELEDLTHWVEENRFHLCHWFTVDDLMYLKRGGRIGAATAVMGTMLNIKPVLHMDDAGHLINVSKARGRKASIDALAAKAGQLGLPGKNETMFICHGDCIEDAEYLAAQVKEKLGVKNVFIGYTGAVIGSHSGPGTLALFFMGEHR